MLKDVTLDRVIGENVLRKFDEDREAHIPSGKLSASILGNPLQWQVLKVIGVPTDFDEYVKRKLQRGKDVEDWIMKQLPGLVEGQKEIEYRGVVGYVDAVVDMKDYDFKCGVIPHEIKSVSNAKYLRIVGKGGKPGQGADHSHCLQVALYALAMGSEYGAIDYIATDDYRIETYIIKAADFKAEIDGIINKFDEAISSGYVPEFVEKEVWQSNQKYNSYYEFSCYYLCY